MAVALRDGRARRGRGRGSSRSEVSVGRSVRAPATGRGVPVASASTAFSAFLMADGDHFDSVAGTSLPEASVVPSLGRDLAASLPKRELTCEGFFGGAGP